MNIIKNYDEERYLIDRVIKTILSCENLNQLVVAENYLQLAMNRIGKLWPDHKIVAAQFGLDMSRILLHKLNEI